MFPNIFPENTDAISITLEILETHINGMMLYVSVYEIFLHHVFETHLLCFIICTSVEHSTLIIYNNLFIHSPLVDIWVVPGILAFISKHTINIQMQVFNYKAINFSLLVLIVFAFTFGFIITN